MTEPLPPHPFAHAEARFRAGDFAGCLEHCRRLLALDPADRAACHLHGVALVRLGRPAEGAGLLLRALAAAPDDLMLRLDGALALAAGGAVEAAIALMADGVRYHPGDPDLAARLARLLSDHDRHREAQAVLRAALRLRPDHLELRGQLAAELAADLQIAAALGQMRLLQTMLPDQSPLYANEGVLRQSLGQLPAAIAAYRRAILIDADNHVAQVNLGTALLTAGNHREGFARYEHRLALPDMRLPPAALPRWRGEPAAGKRLLVTVEQGFGDIVQFLRFLPLLRGRFAAVWLDCPPELRRLLTGLPDLTGLVSAGEALPPVDLAVPLLSLPHLLAIGNTALAESIPYLPAPAAGPTLPSDGRPRVGLVWRGRPAKGELFIRRTLARRSCALAELAPLWRRREFAWHSLQLDGGGELEGTGIIDLAPRIGDFADSAYLIGQLDLVISIDSAAAHLTAALGRPLWLMLAPGQCDYRWGGTAGPSPWYPAVRLFRGDEGGFAALANDMAGRLDEL